MLISTNRFSAYAVLAIAFVCSLLFAAEFDLVTLESPASSRTQRLELEELLSLSVLFSLLLAALGILNGILVSRERRSRAAVEDAAFVDPLTGLSNRRRFLECLEHALSCGGSGDACALLLLDLDGFKQVNDTFGHAAGDALLVEVARRLRTVATKPEYAARLGGDEFALILEGADAQEFAARIFLSRLYVVLGSPMFYAGTTLAPSGSVGLAFASSERMTAADLLAAADLDMYRAKPERKNTLAA